jgi:hypothetical protein
MRTEAARNVLRGKEEPKRGNAFSFTSSCSRGAQTIDGASHMEGRSCTAPDSHTFSGNSLEDTPRSVPINSPGSPHSSQVDTPKLASGTHALVGESIQWASVADKLVIRSHLSTGVVQR